MSLVSLFRRGAVVLTALAFFLPGSALAQTEPAVAQADSTVEWAHFVVIQGDTLWVAETMEVVGSRVPAALPGLVRTVSILTADDLDRAPARSAAEALQTVPGVVVSQRQQYGVQSDLTIRGSTFDQVQMLLNGFDVSDPQTGHHLMNLPIGRHDIARLEVLPGQGSVQYGAGAFGGTVNVVTKRPADRTGGEAAVLGGGNGTWGARGSVDLAGSGHTAGRISVERFHTDGYDVLQEDGTTAWGGNDADTGTVTGRLVSGEPGGELDLFGGIAERQYGALDFYAPYPSTERTRTRFVSGLYRFDAGDRLTLEPRFFYRRHEDLFILFRDNPDAYTNDHLTRKMGAEMRGIVDLGGRHAMALSLEGVYEDIDSRGMRAGVWGEALGRHLRRRVSASVEVDDNGGRLRWQVGGRVDARNDFTPRFAGTGAVSFDLGGSLTARSSLGNVYRIPTFTDLYYQDPSNIGNPDLKPEEGWTWDAGLEMDSGPWIGYASYFERYETNRIEWARLVGDPVWQVLNIAEGTVRGVEAGAGWRHGRGHGVTVGWTWLEKDSEFSPGFEGKYSLLVPRHALTAQGTAVLPLNLSWTVTGRYLEHTGGPADFREFFVLDSRLDWKHRSGWFAGVTGTNLLDRRYEEIPGVMMPGILFTGTVGKVF
ncbi:MAG: TonB-dependent receptor [Candidatus Krumholzibacteriota bacterium]